MSTQPLTTLERIHQAARQEFLAKGFQRASLRKIVQSVGMTTGAFYGYYRSKADLFAALVGPAYDYILGRFLQAQQAFAALPPQRQVDQLSQVSGRCMEDILHYAYDHLEACQLLLCCAEGTRYADLVDEMVAWISTATIYASWVLSAGSALLALVPFWYIWKILEEVLAVAPHFAQAQHLVEYGWLAVGSSVLAVLVYIAGLMCSHMGAFRVATNLRIQAMEHIVTLPLGLAEAFGSGKLRKIVNESSGATETYLAHQLPDRAGAIATPCGPVPGVGHRLHQGAPGPHAVVHHCHQRGVCLPHRRRPGFDPGRGRPGLPAGPALLHHHHAGDCPHPHPDHVPERERHDCG